VKTAFDRDFEEWMPDPEFATGYAVARARVDAFDRITRELDAVRQTRGLSKTALAKLANLPAQTVRRFFSQSGANPTLSTIVAIALAVDLVLVLEPVEADGAERV
jgi:DNA-binding phage protein